jgi:hypothetical protein
MFAQNLNIVARKSVPLDSRGILIFVGKGSHGN